MTRLVIGIDPGLGGAMSMLGSDGLQALASIPVVAKGRGAGKVKNEVNAAGLNQLLRDWVNGHADEVMVVIERVSSMPGQGVASQMSLGDTVGCIRGVVAARGYPVQFVTPQAWKRHHGIAVASEIQDRNKRAAMGKELARARAINLYPAADLARKSDHGKAEAILIARYGWECLR